MGREASGPTLDGAVPATGGDVAAVVGEHDRTRDGTLLVRVLGSLQDQQTFKNQNKP